MMARIEDRIGYKQEYALAALSSQDISALGGAITSKAVAPLAQYQELMGSALQLTRTTQAVGDTVLPILG
jgi:hypothetical protein